MMICAPHTAGSRMWVCASTCLCVLLTGCATGETEVNVGSIVLPSSQVSSGPGEGSLQRYYDTVFTNMRDALDGGGPTAFGNSSSSWSSTCVTICGTAPDRPWSDLRFLRRD